MNKIQHVIGSRKFQYLLSQIASVLEVEIEGQFNLTNNENYDLNVFVERTTPFDVSELPAVNIALETGNWFDKHQGCVKAKYVFIIDCVTSSITNIDEPGDRSSSLKSQDLAGLVQAILEDPIYKWLGFEPPFISKTLVADMKFGVPAGADAKNTSLARVYFQVETIEESKLLVPRLAEGFDTRATLDNTIQGYNYTANQ